MDCILQEAWRECRETFGKGNVLLVSNSAGSHLDAGEIQVNLTLGSLSLHYNGFLGVYTG